MSRLAGHWALPNAFAPSRAEGSGPRGQTCPPPTPGFQIRGSQAQSHILTLPQMEGVKFDQARTFLAGNLEPQQQMGTPSIGAREVFRGTSARLALPWQDHAQGPLGLRPCSEPRPSA